MTGRAWAWLLAGAAAGALIAGALAMGAVAVLGSDLPEAARHLPASSTSRRKQGSTMSTTASSSIS